jgi:glycosyltransferase involved in cell wall biosynthesis
MKPRVLYLCGQAPWPRNGGALLRNYWMIHALSRRYAVDLIVAEEPGEMPAAFANLVDDYACFPRMERDRGGLRRVMLAARPGESLLTAGWTNPAMRAYVAERVGRYPYVAIQTDLPMVGALPKRDAIPLVYNAHNCESALLERRAPLEPSYMGTVLRIEAQRVRHLERSLLSRSSLVTACTEDDILDFERFAPDIRRNAVVIPNGVDVSRYVEIRNARSRPGTVLITGSMDWRPNILGLRWFLRSVLPLLRDRAPDVVVRVAGRMQPDLVAELKAYPNIEAIPNPDDMRAHLADATVIAAPILASSGTRLRILEAWAAGRPVVTTAAGAFGLECDHAKELVMYDDPTGFANGIVALLDSPSLRSWLTGNAQHRVTQYDWNAIGTQLLAAYDRFDEDVVLPRIPTISGEVAATAART